MSEPIDGNPTNRSIRQLLDVVRDHFRYLTTSSPARARRQFAAAGLARCHALLAAILAVREAGRGDVTGMLVRAIAETWLVSLYVLHKGEGADNRVLGELVGDFLYRQGKVAKSLQNYRQRFEAELAQWRPIVDENETTVAGLNYREIAKALDELLVRAGAQAHATVLYDHLYRQESAYDAHAALGMLNRYIAVDEDAGRLLVLDNPGPSFPGNAKAAAVLTAILARHVFTAFDVYARPSMEELLPALEALPNDD